MTPALADVLQRPDIWRGDAIAVVPAPTLSSGFTELDAQLPGGGWPRGQLTELLHQNEGLGELSLLMPALSALTVQGKTVVLVAPPHRAHAPAWAAAGVMLSHLRLVFPKKPRDVLWATVAALRCTEVAATMTWIDLNARLLANSLRRLHVAAGEGGGCAFLFRPSDAATEASPAPLRLQIEADASGLRVTLLKRRGAPARQPLTLKLPRPVAPARPAYSSSGLRHAVADHPSGTVAHRDPLVA